MSVKQESKCLSGQYSQAPIILLSIVKQIDRSDLQNNGRSDVNQYFTERASFHPTLVSLPVNIFEPLAVIFLHPLGG